MAPSPPRMRTGSFRSRRCIVNCARFPPFNCEGYARTPEAPSNEALSNWFVGSNPTLSAMIQFSRLIYMSFLLSVGRGPQTGCCRSVRRTIPDFKSRIMTADRNNMTIEWGPDHPQWGLTVEDVTQGGDPSADFSRWSRLPFWTIEEATALSFGFDPDIACWDDLVSEEHPFSQEYRLRRKIICRAVETGQLPNPITPTAFAAFANESGFSKILAIARRTSPPGPKYRLGGTAGRKVRQTLLRLGKGMVMARFGKLQSAKEVAIKTGIGIEYVKKFLKTAHQDDDLLEPEEYDILAEFVIRLAVEEFGYDPKAGRSRIYAEISQQLDGPYQVDEDTIRSRLKEIAAHRTT